MRRKPTGATLRYFSIRGVVASRDPPLPCLCAAWIPITLQWFRRIRLCDSVCQTNFRTWWCLAKGQSSSPAAWGILVLCAFESLPSLNFTKCISFPGSSCCSKVYDTWAIMAIKHMLCWDLGSLHVCNLLFLPPPHPIWRHKVLMAKDLCAKWFHYIQKPLPLARKSRCSGIRGHTPTQTNTWTQSGKYTHTVVVSCLITLASDRKWPILILL